MLLVRKTVAAACALVIACGLAACNKKEQGTHKEPAREGLALPLAGLEYEVFITRQLNPAIPPDSAYYKGPPAAKGKTLYGIFIKVCNKHDSGPAIQSSSRFKITDNQGNVFQPSALPADNDFAYHPGLVRPKECIPEAGSVAQLGPTAGAMVLFELPLTTTENRPLELDIEGPQDLLKGKRAALTVELDI